MTMPKETESPTTSSIASLMRIHPNFMRSVHLERDIKDSISSLGYILTPTAEQALNRIKAGFKGQSTQRAWRLTGDYGTGKTDFGLMLSRVAKGARDELPRDVHQFISRNKFFPAMATGDREPLGSTILRAIDPSSIERKNPPSTKEVLKTVRNAVAQARKKFKGLLLIIDELGKNLEYISRNPGSDDIFLLQQLAEEAARSGDSPFVIIVMLHQGVTAYATGLDTVEKQEWNKVAGRFEEIVYAQPVEQMATLVAATLNLDVRYLPDGVLRKSELSMVAALKAGLYGSSAGSSLKNLGPKIFPLHPTVLPVLIRTMRRFGQNERSLFSFISSAEPMGLQDYASSSTITKGFYRIHNLFDYVRSNMLPGVNISNAGTHWGVIESILSSTEIGSKEEEAVLKTVALLNLLDAPDIPPTEDNIFLAVGGSRKAVKKAVKLLRDRGVLYERGSVRGLFLWPHTSVSLDEAFEQALKATGECYDPIEALCEHVQSEHLVPRAYYVRTGTLRFAEVKLISANSLDNFLSNQPMLDGKGADINIRVVLPSDERQKRDIEQKLERRSNALNNGLIIAVAEPPLHAASTLKYLIAWRWVKQNIPELSGDSYAREEVVRRISSAEKNLHSRLSGLDNLAVPNTVSLIWFGGSVSGRIINPGRKLLDFLGEECLRIYSEAPAVLNELINRRYPSASAVAARTKIAEAMANNPHLENLGMDDSRRPAEMALYISVVHNSGFHIRDDDSGGWLFKLPSKEQDKCEMLPSINAITDLLNSSVNDAMVPVTKIFQVLAAPPYGVRNGLMPLILALYLATHHQRVALYEDRTYLPSVGGDEFQRLMKEPGAFHLQYCALEGVRGEAFLKLLSVLNYSPRDPDAVDLLDLVRPLVVFIAQGVSDYARHTNTLPARAIAIRRVLMESREPVRMVFTELPKACGFSPISSQRDENSPDPKELARQLKEAMRDIQTAYPKLLKRIGDSLCAAFGLDQDMPKGRDIISARAAQLVPVVTEPALKAFSLRLADTKLEYSAWLGSVANMLARKSPERWRDMDETEFLHQLEIISGRFKRTEFALIGSGKNFNGHALRIALTRGDGTEVGDLVDWDGLDEAQLKEAQSRVDDLLDQLGSHGLAGVMKSLWYRFDDKNRLK